jgi:lipopolysaccharide transport system ATP-binding protein
MKPIIKIDNLSKQYRLGTIGTGTLQDDFNRWWHTIRGKEDPYLKIGEANDRTSKGTSDYVWAMRNINLEVMPGEVLGIIGKNGAGKSTLLKLLSRVTAPTTGSIKTRGRMASLLEVGTGFHPELSGRDNIFLNGAILGMSKNEIKSKFDQIVDFAGCERYIDTPVKRYSSGMYVRLAFAVAAHLEPDILVVDEVLAVGDAEFQEKAIGKMKDVSTKEGRTVLFVSHNMAAIEKLCTRGVLLENGEISFFSSNIKEVVNKYYLNGSVTEKTNSWIANSKVCTNEYIQLQKLYVSNKNKESLPIYSRDENIYINFDFEVFELNPLFEIGFVLYDENETPIFKSLHVDVEKENWPKLKAGINNLQCFIPSYYLNDGEYRIEFVASLYNIKYLYNEQLGGPSIYFSIRGKLSNSPMFADKRIGIMAPILKYSNN